MRIFGILLLAAILAACTTTKNEPLIIKPKLTVVMPPDEYFNTCRKFTNFPDPETLKDDEVAKLVISLYKNGVTCYETVQAIRKYLEVSRKTIEK